MLRLRIISPEKTLFNGEVDSVSVPGTLGSFEILTGHAPIISTLETGTVAYRIHGNIDEIEIRGGFVEVQKDEVVMAVEV